MSKAVSFVQWPGSWGLGWINFVQFDTKFSFPLDNSSLKGTNYSSRKRMGFLKIFFSIFSLLKLMRFTSLILHIFPHECNISFQKHFMYQEDQISIRRKNTWECNHSFLVFGRVFYWTQVVWGNSINFSKKSWK